MKGGLGFTGWMSHVVHPGSSSPGFFNKQQLYGMDGSCTSQQRSALPPDVPTLQEAGVEGYESLAWYGLLVPSGTPQSIVEQLNRSVREALNEPEVRERVAELGSASVHDTPEAFGAFICQDRVKWGAIVKRTGVTVD